MNDPMENKYVLQTIALPGTVVLRPEPNANPSVMVDHLKEYIGNTYLKVRANYEDESEAAIHRLMWMAGLSEGAIHTLYKNQDGNLRFYYCFYTSKTKPVKEYWYKSRNRKLKENNIVGECPICFEEVRAKDNASIGCNHIACLSCVREYIFQKVNQKQTSRYNLTCVHNDCPCFYNSYHVFAVCGFSKEHPILIKYLKNQVISEFEKSPHSTYCSNVNCERVMIGEPGKRKIVCTDCNTSTCTRCKKSFHRFSICRKQTNNMQSATWRMRLYYLRNGTRPCPNCRFLIEKVRGCDHMTCLKCNYEFCWRCGKHYTSEHFNNPLNCAGGAPLSLEFAVWGPLAPAKKLLEVVRDCMIVIIVGGGGVLFAWPYMLVRSRESIGNFFSEMADEVKRTFRRMRGQRSHQTVIQSSIL